MSISIAPIGKLRITDSVTRRADSVFVGSSVTWFGEFRHPVTGALTSVSLAQFWFLAPEPFTVIVDDEETTVNGIMVNGIETQTGVYAATVSPGLTGVWVVRLLANGAQCDERTIAVEGSAFGEIAEGDTVLVDGSGNWLLWPNGLLVQGDAP